ncbi:hypothetical protein ACNKHS_10635 [Shigella flexneri]
MEQLQASANQRKGRCGRVSEGICIRLYSEDDFLSRRSLPTGNSAHQPGIRYPANDRAGAGRYRRLPFVEAPDKRRISGRVRLLEELGAITTDAQATAYKLTPLGRQLSQLPVNPRLARMVLERKSTGSCVRR